MESWAWGALSAGVCSGLNQALFWDSFVPPPAALKKEKPRRELTAIKKINQSEMALPGERKKEQSQFVRLGSSFGFYMRSPSVDPCTGMLLGGCCSCLPSQEPGVPAGSDMVLNPQVYEDAVFSVSSLVFGEYILHSGTDGRF